MWISKREWGRINAEIECLGANIEKLEREINEKLLKTTGKNTIRDTLRKTMYRYDFNSRSWRDAKNGYIKLLVENQEGVPTAASWVIIFEDSIDIGFEVIDKMEKIPKIDKIEEITRSNILLNYLRETSQKAEIFEVRDFDRLILGQWKDVFHLG